MDGQFCGGVLVAPHVVVTVDHCLADRDVSTVDVVIGVSNLCSNNAQSERRGIVEVIYPKASPHLAYLLLDDLVETAPAEAQPEALDERRGLVVGWGRLSETKVGPCLQKKIPMTILSPSECASELRALGTETIKGSEYTCAAPAEPSGNNSCFGDSGGALLIHTSNQWSVKALTLAGEDCLPTSKTIHRNLVIPQNLADLS
ncbi:trypsin-like serine protease [Paenarthrobacter sp. NPDC090520]|uniref:trypsin-like serine protease n=1 Tax=Paenarthrobacter sp. NPDC090520 TaxID=3364382 RepID=UPI003806A74D